MSVGRRLFALFRPYWKPGISIFFILIASTLLTVTTPFFYKILIDDGILNGNHSTLLKGIFILIIMMLSKEIFFLIEVSLRLNIRKSLFSTLRMKIYEHCLQLPQSFYADYHKGRMLSRITNDVDSIEDLLLDKFVYFMKDLLVGVFIFLIILFINWKMIVVASLFLPILFILYLVFKTKIYTLSKKVHENQEKMIERLQEDLSMVKAIQSYSLLKERKIITNRLIMKNEEVKKNLHMKYSVASSSTIVINLIGLVVIWGMGGIEVLKGNMTIGTLIAISFYLNHIMNLFYSAYYIVLGFHKSLPTARRIFQTLDIPVSNQSKDGLNVTFIDRIEFEDITFSYKERNPVLENVSFSVLRGETVGIVGKSGQGKTTLANLLMRFYDPIAGQIKMDGIDIQHLQLDCLRSQIALVPQEDYLFNVSLRDNILLGRKNISEEQFQSACESANVIEFAMLLENGFDTIIGENGIKLSTGQKKRISIARALIEQPFILIFDEVTSVLDIENEKEILTAIHLLAKNRIVFIITHKEENIMAVDKVLYVNHHKVEMYNSYESYVENTRKTVQTS